MKRILLSVILLLAFDFVCGCGHTRVEAGSGANKDDVKQVPMVYYSYKPNGLQSLEYNAELNDGKLFITIVTNRNLSKSQKQEIFHLNIKLCRICNLALGDWKE